MKFIQIHIVLLMLSVIFSGSLKASEQRNIEIVFDEQVEVCNDKYDFLFFVKIGEVTIEDNFVGFEVAFNYDNTKIRIFPNMLRTGTISGKLEYDADYFRTRIYPIEGTTRSTFIAEGMHIWQPVAGPKGQEYLVAFQGEYFGDDTCGIYDYLDLEWIYFPNYLEKQSFPNQEIVYVDNITEIETGDIEQFNMEVLTSFEAVELDSAKEYSAGVSMLKNGKAQNVRFTIENSKPESFNIVDIIKADDENLDIKNIEYLKEGANQKVLVDVELLENVELYHCFDIKFDISNQITDSTNFTILLEDVDNCKCINDFQSNSKKIKNVIPVVSVINDMQSDDIIITDDYVIINNPINIRQVYICDINGEIIKTKQPNSDRFIINKTDFLNGAYFIIIENMNGSKQIRKILVNN